MNVLKYANIENAQVDLDIQYSEDDGVTWEKTTSVHINDKVTDFPQGLIQDESIYVSYSYLPNFPFVQTSKLYLRKSDDDGMSWNPVQISLDSTVSSIGVAIGKTKEDLLITSGNRNNDSIYILKSDASLDHWSTSSSFSVGNDIKGQITKLITNENQSVYGVISHLAHQNSTEIYFTRIEDEQVESIQLGLGAYGEGILLDDGSFHVVYHTIENGSFEMRYMYLGENESQFSNPVTLFSAAYDEDGRGEYHSMEVLPSGNFLLVFSDWSDGSSAKVLEFSPYLSSTIEDSKSNIIHAYPNPAHDIINFEISFPISDARLELYSLNGEKIHVDQFISDSTIEVDVSNIEGGIYLLRLSMKEKVFIIKMVKN